MDSFDLAESTSAVVSNYIYFCLSFHAVHNLLAVKLEAYLTFSSSMFFLHRAAAAVTRIVSFFPNCLACSFESELSKVRFTAAIDNKES